MNRGGLTIYQTIVLDPPMWSIALPRPSFYCAGLKAARSIGLMLSDRRARRPPQCRASINPSAEKLSAGCGRRTQGLHSSRRVCFLCCNAQSQDGLADTFRGWAVGMGRRRPAMYNFTRRWVGGQHSSGRLGKSTNPAAGEVIGQYHDAAMPKSDAGDQASTATLSAPGWRHDKPSHADVTIKCAVCFGALRAASQSNSTPSDKAP
jgi:hypothetical protein